MRQSSPGPCLVASTRYFIILVLVAMVSTTWFGVTNADAADWKGTESSQDGFKVIMNPATAMESASTVKLEELWRLGGDTDDEDEFFGVIADIRIDDEGNVYLLDSQLAEVKIYTADGEFVNSIGREGEGPGEFRQPVACFFTENDKVAVLQSMPGKIVLLGKDGEPAGEHPLPKTEDGGWQMLQGGKASGGNTVLFMSRQKMDTETNQWTRGSFLASVNSDGEQLAEYTSRSNTIDFANAEIHDASFDTFDRRWTLGSDGRVYAATSYADYDISIWNVDGTPDRKIQREFTHRPRSDEEKDFMNRMMGHYAQMIPDCTVRIEESCKDIETFYVRDDGSVWVLNANGARDNPDNSLGVFDAYDDQGHFVKEVTLMGQGDAKDDLYIFVKDRLYVVTSFLQAAMSAQAVQGLYDEDDEAEPMAVICYKLEGDLLSSR